MNYYKKTGVRNQEEQALLQAIEKVIEEKGINRNEIPDCQNVDDLIEVKHLIDAYVITTDTVQTEPEAREHEQEHQPEQEPEEIEANSEEIQEPEEPSIEVVEEAEPETVELEVEQLPIEQNNSISDATETEFEEVVENDDLEFDSGDYDPFATQIIERSYSGGEESQALSDQDELEPSEFNLDLDEARDATPLDSAEERTKKKTAEQTANTILKGYARLAPKPFKWLSKFNETRIEKLSFSGHLDLNIEVSPGVTFDDYVKQTNEQVDEIFEVDEDTLEEIREPLVEVLMEQQMQLTPQQRLGMAVLSHLMQMFTVSMKLRSQNNRILEYQKELTRLSRTNVA